MVVRRSGDLNAVSANSSNPFSVDIYYTPKLIILLLAKVLDLVLVSPVPTDA